MSIEELVNRAYTTWAHDKGTSWTDHMRAALTEQADTHALELRAYEATVQNLKERIRQMEGELAESQKRIRQLAAEHERKQALLLEAHCERVSSLQERIRELEALMVPDVRCKCCGYLVTESEHKGCLRAADATAPDGWKLVPDTLKDCSISCGYSPSVTGSCVPFVTLYMPEMDINDEAGWDRRNKIADALDPLAAAPKKEGE